MSVLRGAGQSMRFRILMLMVAIFIIAASITGFYVSRHSLHELDEILNANLAQSARSLHALISGELDQTDWNGLQAKLDRYASLQPAVNHAADREFGATAEERAEQVEYQRQIYLHVENLRSGQILDSHSQPLQLDSGHTDGYFSTRQGEHNWHFYAVSNDRIRLLLGQRGDYRDELLAESTESVIAPILVISPLLALAIWWGINRGLAPLTRLSGEVSTRASDNLKPVSQQHISTETRALASALNGLLDRLQRALDNERRFTADASHELRTPIASLRVQLEVLQGARSDQEQHNAIVQIDRAIGQMGSLVDDLLSLARLDSHRSLFAPSRFDLRQMLAQAIADAAMPALAQQIDISLQPDKPCHVNSVARLHELIFTNLLSNAIKYTPAGGQIDITLTCEDNGIEYCVDDTGPGIDRDQLQQITERFYRIQNDQNRVVPGAGLGLSIALRASDLLQARLTFDNRTTGGLRARLQCPLPSASSAE